MMEAVSLRFPAVRLLLLGLVLLLIAGCAGSSSVTGVTRQNQLSGGQYQSGKIDTSDAQPGVGPSDAIKAASSIPFRWVDFSAGTMIGPPFDVCYLGPVDDCYEVVSLPFPVLFKDRSVYTTAYVSTNGLITFGAAATWGPDFGNAALPNAGIPERAALPLHDDWITSDPGGGASYGVWTRTVGTAPNREFWVYWVNARHFGACTDRVTFAAVLYEHNRWFDFHYLDTATESSACGDSGASATVGSQSYPWADQYSFNTAAVPSGTGVRAHKVW